MNKKLLETICFFLIILVLIIIGYYTYRSYEDKKNSNDSDAEINNFYDVEYLFNSGYIDMPKVVDESLTIDDVNIHVNNGIVYINNTSNNKMSGIITDLPDDSFTLYYDHLHDFCYEFLAKTEKGNIYYSYVDLTKEHNFSFSLIGDNVDKVYIPVYDKKNVYVNQTSSFATNFIILDNDNNLNYVDYDKEYRISNNLTNKKPYFDYICAGVSNLCNDLIVYITFNDELNYNNKFIKNSDNESIRVSDAFSVFEIKTNKSIDIDALTKDDLKKYNYLFCVYVIDDNKDLYKLEISNKGETVERITTDSNKVKEYMYEKDSSQLTIVFDDGIVNIIKESDLLRLNTSTIYDKRDNNDKMLIKP